MVRTALEAREGAIGQCKDQPSLSDHDTRQSTAAEKAWLDDKDNLPIWAGGRLSFNQAIKELRQNSGSDPLIRLRLPQLRD